MVLLSFSIPEHIALIKDGRKHQTSRIPRKQRSNGRPPYSVGDKIQLYYRSRIQSCCDNCVLDSLDNHCEFYNVIGMYPERTNSCDDWTNFFGETTITGITHYDGNHQYAENGNEIWMGIFLNDESTINKESWARADGFNDWLSADRWFLKQHSEWSMMPLDVLTWDKEPIVRRWQRTE